MICCYILYSPTIDSFYVGFTQESIGARIKKHNEGLYVGSFTTKANDWQLFLMIPADSVSQAMKIEKHIKKMKSRKYIRNLKDYPEMMDKLRGRFQ